MTAAIVHYNPTVSWKFRAYLYVAIVTILSLIVPLLLRQELSCHGFEFTVYPYGLAPIMIVSSALSVSISGLFYYVLFSWMFPFYSRNGKKSKLRQWALNVLYPDVAGVMYAVSLLLYIELYILYHFI